MMEQMDEHRRARGQSFDQVAEMYDTYRPGYPHEMVDYIVSASGIGPSAHVLDIGCGTGKAAESFARRGYTLTCIDPGANMLAVAARRLAGCRVAFVHSTFEDWPEPRAAFDLVISGQAFHWVAQPMGYAKVARALVPGGTLALFWNRPPLFSDPLEEALQQVYAAEAPELDKHEEPWHERIDRDVEEISAAGFFSQVQVRTFLWTARYDAAQYTGLLNTYSDHLTLPISRRERLFAEVQRVIAEHGGYVDRPYQTVLFVATTKNAG
jgi:ubiquinone/menaquinone biosynthesis C-methylase UbiE